MWEPLLALAELAGDDWPDRARRAAIKLSTGVEREDSSLTAQLLTDIAAVFTETGSARLRSATLIEGLASIEESPWGDWHGKPITAHTLSRLLKPYRIKTMTVDVDGQKVRGYKIEQFTNAFTRVGVTSVTGVTSHSTSGIDAKEQRRYRVLQSVTREHGAMRDVTPVTPVTPGNADADARTAEGDLEWH